ncbi:class I SAM-dependent methyltransferase [Candidatus Borrarchaeum sp.]|uniref:class I SAM-dependent methyltransferase n=1 Tax=Candidatus Borrarchaeum sp. TaxID=2846742 RepID=UPI00257A17CB|nr:class I SAM-dependent methyltransferase [Candidatus Borrarchaeum sp.]
MSQEYESDFLAELYKDIPKLGKAETTKKALSMLKGLPPEPTILDVGCGTGMSSIELAKMSAKVVALDINQTFLDILRNNAAAQGVADNIQTINKSMFSMDFEENSFDVIWSENSIFIVGFEKALKEWRFFLKKGGFLVVSIIAKLKDNPPVDAKKYWEKVYPSIKSHNEILKIIEKQGYKLISSFTLPESDWWDNCCAPLEKKILTLREKYGDKFKRELDMNQNEIDYFRKYGFKYYGIVFYIMQN